MYPTAKNKWECIPLGLHTHKGTQDAPKGQTLAKEVWAYVQLHGLCTQEASGIHPTATLAKEIYWWEFPQLRGLYTRATRTHARMHIAHKKHSDLSTPTHIR